MGFASMLLLTKSAAKSFGRLFHSSSVLLRKNLTRKNVVHQLHPQVAQDDDCKQKKRYSFPELKNIKIQEVSDFEKPPEYFDQFYKSLTTQPVDRSSTHWLRSKEHEWLFSAKSEINRPLVDRKPFAASTQPNEKSLSAPGLPSASSLDGEVSLPTRIMLESQALNKTTTLQLFSELVQSKQSPSITTINQVLNVLAEHKDLASVKKIFLELKDTFDLYPSIATLSILLKAYAFSGEAELAEALLVELENAGAKLHKWLIRGYLLKNNHAKIMELYWKAKQAGGPDNELCALAVQSCGKNQEVEKAFLVYKEFLKTNVQPNDELLTALLFACTMRKDYYLEAFSILKQLESYGYKPSVSVYEYLLFGCAKTSDLKTACTVWDELSKSGCLSKFAVTNMLYVLSTIENSENQESGSREFLYQISSEEIVKMAKKIYQEYVVGRRKPPSSHMLCSFLYVMCKNCDLATAKSIFYDEFAAYNIKKHINAYEAMFWLYTKLKMLPEILSLRQEAIADGAELNYKCYQSLIRVTALHDQFDISIDLLREMIKKTKRPELSDLRTLYYKAFQAERMDIVDEMRIVCKPMEGHGTPQHIFHDRSAYIGSLLDEVYGPERGSDKERSTKSMAPSEYKKLRNVSLYKELLDK